MQLHTKILLNIAVQLVSKYVVSTGLSVSLFNSKKNSFQKSLPGTHPAINWISGPLYGKEKRITINKAFIFEQYKDTIHSIRSGVVSVFSLQLAKAMGLRVISTTSSDKTADKLTALGADYVINYKTVPDWDRAVNDLTDGNSVDRVVEVGGGQQHSKLHFKLLHLMAK